MLENMEILRVKIFLKEGRIVMSLTLKVSQYRRKLGLEVRAK